MMPILNILVPDLKRLSAWFAVMAVIILPFIVFWDAPIAWYFEEHLDPGMHRFMGNVTEAANSAIWFGLAVMGFLVCWVIATRTGDTARAAMFRRYTRAWTFMLVSMATAAALLNILKLVIGRYRPRYMFNEGLFGFEPFSVALKMASFPSGHTQSIWSAMIALSFLTPRYTVVYLAVAAVVSVSRFVTAVHFVSDVIAAIFLSVAVAVLMRRWFERNGQQIELSAT